MFDIDPFNFSCNKKIVFRSYYKLNRYFLTFFETVPSIEYTAIPYRASTGPEQGFPCEVLLTGKNLFSLQGTPFLIAGTLFSLQGFPYEKNFTGKTLFLLQGWVCSAIQ